MTGALRDGRFVTLELLGEGSQGHTYNGVDKREGRAVAIKRFDVRGARGWKDVELAEREARVLESLSHPRLPAYVDHFEEDGALYLVMEKIEGETLASLRKRGVILGEDDVVRLLRDAAEVLAYLHSRAPAVIHRDLKPGNVIRRPDGSFAFVDFGAVRDKLKPEGGSTVVGTFGYMAPEQFQGRALPASDVYAIGATALTLLTGTDPEHLPHKGLAIDVRGALRGRASERLIEVLEEMLDPDPDARASELAPLLERLGSGRPPRKKDRDRYDDVGAQLEDWGRDVERAARELEQRMESEAREFELRMREYGREKKRARDDGWRGRRAERRHRYQRERGMPPWPFPLALVATIGISVAIPVVAIMTQMVLPLLFSLLGIFIRGMNKPAAAVKSAGKIAVAAMQRAQRAVQKGITPPRAEEQEPERVRVTPGEAPRVRVVDEASRAPADEIDAAAEAEVEEIIGERKPSKK